MLITLFGLADVIAGILLALAGLFGMGGNGWILTFGILILIKGIYSFAMSASSGFMFDILGIIDMTTGILLLLSFIGINLGLSMWIALIIILKGLYSIAIVVAKP